tara:strand:- start:509 stop:919 length:411 start_codon:yes stop_codon:yes gene_type:complete
MKVNIAQITHEGRSFDVFDASPYEFTMATRGKWEMIVANEKKVFSSNEIMKVSVKEIVIPAETCVVPCLYNRHPVGAVISLMDSKGPKLIEENRVIDAVLVAAYQDGQVEIDDLLGVIHIFPVAFTRSAEKPTKIR